MRIALIASVIPSPSQLVIGLAAICVGLLALTFILFLIARVLKVQFWLVGGAFLAVACAAIAFASHRSKARQMDECEAGNARTCSLFGGMLLYSRDASEKAQGQAILRRACDRGMTGCCGQLAYFEDTFSHDSALKSRALEDYKKDCMGGSEYGCGKAGRTYLVGPAAHDVEEAVRFLTKACRRSDRMPAECADFAELYRKGEGVPRDPVRAAEINHTICDDQGWDYRTGAACRALAEQYALGDGVTKDGALAASYLKRADAHAW